MRDGVAWFSLFLSSVACSSSAPAPQSPAASASASVSASPPASASGGDASPAEAPPAPVAMGPLVWREDMSDREKGAFMKAVVMPRMSKLFREYDAKEFDHFSCKTCHGPTFRDPDEFLPPLHLQGDKFKEEAEKPKLYAFMHEKVMPEMANIFGEPVYDPATQKGFGCEGCHSIQKK